MRVVLLFTPAFDRRARATQTADALGVPRLDVGALVRATAAATTPLGREVQALLNAGALLPDDRVLGLLAARLEQPDARAGFLLDGFPRSVAQARALDALLADLQRPLDAAVQLEVDDAPWRAHAEHAHADAEALGARLRELSALAAPVAEYYRAQGKLLALERVLARAASNP